MGLVIANPDLPTCHGDVLSEVAEHQVEPLTCRPIAAATDNAACNTHVTTDLAPGTRIVLLSKPGEGADEAPGRGPEPGRGLTPPPASGMAGPITEV